MQFIDLQAQYRAYQGAIDAGIKDVLDSSRYINGPQIKELEEALAAFTGAKHAIGCASGTAALVMNMLAWRVRPGDEVITTPFTFFATAEVIALMNAKSVFVDVDPETLNIDATKIEAAITEKTKAIIPVSLYGQCADLDAVNAIAAPHGIPVLEDACQSLGATIDGRQSCSLTTAAAVSFFPSKPLGCYGDGGMAFTNDDDLAERLRSIRNHGQGERYLHHRLGFNGRLDSIQAAVLLAKLPHFQGELDARQKIAAGYAERLQGKVRLPVIKEGHVSAWAQYTVRSENRDAIKESMTAADIPSAVHYPMCLHQQPVFQGLGYQLGDFPEAERASQEVISLPMHPFLTEEEQDRVAAAVIAGA